MLFSRIASPATRVLMVCMGNICRSPMAQCVALHLASQAGPGMQVRVDSAGTHAGRGGTPIDPRARAVLTMRGYPVVKGRARQVTDKDFDRFDMVLAMDQSNMNDLRQLCPGEHSHKLRLLLEFAPALGVMEIPDPYYGSAQGFEKVLDLCEAGVQGLLDYIRTIPR
jgi:protein-tyrosine phosphatase